MEKNVILVDFKMRGIPRRNKMRNKKKRKISPKSCKKKLIKIFQKNSRKLFELKIIKYENKKNEDSMNQISFS